MGVAKRGGPSYELWLADSGEEGLTEYRPAYGIEKVLVGGAPMNCEGGVVFYDPALTPDPENPFQLGHRTQSFWGGKAQVAGLWEAVQCSVSGAEALELAKRMGFASQEEGFAGWEEEGVMNPATSGAVKEAFCRLLMAVAQVCTQWENSGRASGSPRWANNQLNNGRLCHTRMVRGLDWSSPQMEVYYSLGGGWSALAEDSRPGRAGERPFLRQFPCPHPPNLLKLTSKGARDYVTAHVHRELEDFMRQAEVWFRDLAEEDRA